MDASTSVWATHLQGITLSAMRSRRVPDVPTARTERLRLPSGRMLLSHVVLHQ